MIQLPGPSFFLSAAAVLPSKPLPTEEPAVHEQACNHSNRGCQITDNFASITVTTAIALWLKHSMKHLSSMGLTCPAENP